MIPAGGGAVPPSFGGYFWGGVPPQNPSSLANGQGYLNTVGFNSTRLVITPRMRSGNPIDNYYNLNLAALSPACPTANAFLPCTTRRPKYQAAISTPSLRKIVLTAYDSASSGPFGASANYVDPTFWQSTANHDAVHREFRDLTYAKPSTILGKRSSSRRGRPTIRPIADRFTRTGPTQATGPPVATSLHAMARSGRSPSGSRSVAPES